MVGRDFIAKLDGHNRFEVLWQYGIFGWRPNIGAPVDVARTGGLDEQAVVNMELFRLLNDGIIDPQVAGVRNFTGQSGGNGALGTYQIDPGILCSASSFKIPIS